MKQLVAILVMLSFVGLTVVAADAHSVKKHCHKASHKAAKK